MLTDAEIQALMDLPDGAREALKGVEGPGWTIEAGEAVMDGDRITISAQAVLRHCWPSDWGPIGTWLPCSPLGILTAAGQAASDKALLVARLGPPRHSIGDDVGGRWWAALDSYDDTYSLTQYGDTPRLAALALLADVWK